MATEHRSARYEDLDAWPSLDILSALFEGQLSAVATVRSALPVIAAAAETAVDRLRRGGRLVYIGAGTSGRVAVQDGAELSPTFDWPEERVVFAMAGGEDALLKAIENAEDSVEDGIARMREAGVGPDDVVIGVAASGTTPFTVAALKEAAARGAQTIGVSNNADALILTVCSNPILVDTGEEVIAGSTRMKAGTAQKVVLNLLSSLIMIRLGRVYRGLMVHMRTANAKLRRRSLAMVQQITGCDERSAADALMRGDGDVKLASLIVFGADRATASDLLSRNDDNLRLALADLARKRAAQTGVGHD